MFQEKIEVNGKSYILQHPGNRAFQKVAGQSLKVSNQGTHLDTLPIMEFAFEFCLIPGAGSPKLSIDGPYKDGQKPSIANTTKEEFIEWQREYEEVWVKILPSFLRGSLETTVFWGKGKQPNTSPSDESETVGATDKSNLQGVGPKNRRGKDSKLPGS